MTLRAAIRSILWQTFADWELLLIDDGSSDETLQIAHQLTDPRIKIYSDGMQQGLPARLNQAINMSAGEYFARMDGDDMAHPQRLEKQIQYLQQNPGVDLVGARVIVFRQAGLVVGQRAAPESHGTICRKPFTGFSIAHPTFVGKIDWFRRYLYRNDAMRCEDQDLLLRSYRFSRFANVPEILLGYREEKIDISKIFIARLFLVRSLFREFCRQRRLDLACRACIEQILKAAIDYVAISSGLNYRLLQHRARPVSQTERQDWEQIWKALNQLETYGDRTH